jgi:hypothetical protein
MAENRSKFESVRAICDRARTLEISALGKRSNLAKPTGAQFA